MQGLAALRAELDRIDNNILELIERRLGIALDIAAEKEIENDRYLKIRPRRQHEVLSRLKTRATRAAPKLVDEIWCEIMAHSLQAQAPLEIILAPSSEPELLEARVRAKFGSAAPVRWATSTQHALRAALEGEVIAVVPDPVPEDGGDLRTFDAVNCEDGRPIAHVAGRIKAEDIAADEKVPLSRRAKWSPGSWRSQPARQIPQYPDPDALAKVERRLSRSDPLAETAEIIRLRLALARVAQGDAFILQGGDCAESFAEFSAEKVRVTHNLLLRMGAVISASGCGEIVHLARIAGQFAKPRTSDTETVGGVTLPSYRGDAVNGPAFTTLARTPDPTRLIEAYRQAKVTIELLNAYGSASYADLPAHYEEAGLKEVPRPITMFTSHEALLLSYEQALTRYDEERDQWWAMSGHMLWIGDRTRELDGAHVEFARGVANPIGLKCGPNVKVDDLLRLVGRLDPDNSPGRLVLIGRFGASGIFEHLPKLMEATRREGLRAIWSVDPMHGNTCTIDGLKTRMVADILDEVQNFFDIADATNVHPGGVHLEMTGSDVTECIGGSVRLAREDLDRSYLTHCDPRLNESQALDVARVVTQRLARLRRGRAEAA